MPIATQKLYNNSIIAIPTVGQYIIYIIYNTLHAHCAFSHTHSVKYLPILFRTLYFTLYDTHVLNHIVLTFKMDELLKKEFV